MLHEGEAEPIQDDKSATEEHDTDPYQEDNNASSVNSVVSNRKT